MMTVGLAQSQITSQPSVPPGEKSPLMPSPTESASNALKDLFPSGFLFTSNARRGVSAWGQQVASDHPQYVIRDLSETRRDNVRFSQAAMAVFTHILIERAEETSSGQPNAEL